MRWTPPRPATTTMINNSFQSVDLFQTELIMISISKITAWKRYFNFHQGSNSRERAPNRSNGKRKTRSECKVTQSGHGLCSSFHRKVYESVACPLDKSACYPGIQFRLPCTSSGQFFMGAKMFIGTPWMRNEGVLKKNLVWAM